MSKSAAPWVVWLVAGLLASIAKLAGGDWVGYRYPAFDSKLLSVAVDFAVLFILFVSFERLITAMRRGPASHPGD